MSLEYEPLLERHPMTPNRNPQVRAATLKPDLGRLPFHASETRTPYLFWMSVHHEYDLAQGIGAFPWEFRLTAPMP